MPKPRKKSAKSRGKSQKAPSPAVVEPTCVGIRTDGDVCGSPNIKSRKYQLCNTCYTRACRTGALAALKVYHKARYSPRDYQKTDKKPKSPRFESSPDDVSTEKESKQSFSYGKFDVSGMEKWEKAFVFSRKKDVAEAFDDPTSKGIAHRWVQSELFLERLRRKAMEYQEAEDFVKLNAALSQIDRMEKMVQGLQKELNFLPSQTAEDKKVEEIFSNMEINYRKHKARLVAGFDAKEVELMVKKGMNVELERKRLAEITGRLSMERARSLVISIVDAAMDVARDVFNINDEQAMDLMERLSVRVKSKIPEIVPFID